MDMIYNDAINFLILAHQSTDTKKYLIVAAVLFHVGGLSSGDEGSCQITSPQKPVREQVKIDFVAIQQLPRGGLGGGFEVFRPPDKSRHIKRKLASCLPLSVDVGTEGVPRTGLLQMEHQVHVAGFWR